MITQEMIPKIEKAFGFSLYDWQKDYLLEKDSDIPWEQLIKRGNGKTFAYCVKLLLSDGEPINKRELFKYIDDCTEYLISRIHNSSHYNWFANYCLDINNILVKAGFKTRIE